VLADPAPSERLQLRVEQLEVLLQQVMSLEQHRQCAIQRIGPPQALPDTHQGPVQPGKPGVTGRQIMRLHIRKELPQGGRQQCLVAQ